MLKQSPWEPGIEEGMSCVLSDEDGNELYVLTVFPRYVGDEWRWHIDGDFPEYVDARTTSEKAAKSLAVAVANAMYVVARLEKGE